jgi:phosphoribosylanthranilate isomerase
MKIKICGLRSFNEVSMTEAVGADFLGFIHVKRSKRYVNLQLIKILKSRMEQPHKAILVIEPENQENALKNVLDTGINHLQLHSLSPNQIQSLKKKFNLHVTRAIGLIDEISPEKKREIESFAHVCNVILFDYEVNGHSGGTGNQIPLQVALEGTEIVKNISDSEIFLAGGISPEFILKHRKTLYKHFDGLDINSGVEKPPGFKDGSKLNKLMEICR